MNGMARLMAAALAAALAGCFTIREPEYPAVTINSLAEGNNVRVQLAGFDATVTTYVPTYGYTTVVGGGPWYGRRGWHYGFGATTYATTEFIPQTSSTAAFRDRATDTLERSGCILQTQEPQYRVEVRFEGPYSDSSDGWAAAGWMVFTLFTADYGAQNWTARLKIHDLRTGRLVFSRDYSQRYEALVWGPIPIFSPSFSDATSSNVMKCWCLNALTDSAVADAVNFFRGLPVAPSQP